MLNFRIHFKHPYHKVIVLKLGNKFYFLAADNYNLSEKLAETWNKEKEIIR